MPNRCRTVVDDPLARAVVYRTLSLGFQSPSDDRLQQVGAPEGFPVLIAALRHLRAEGCDERFEPVIARLRSLPPEAGPTLRERFVRLFGHTARGLVCPCETEYGPADAFHQPHQLADVSGYYLAFGLKPLAASDVRVDHVASECEFMDFLSRKEAWWVARCAESDAHGRVPPEDAEMLEVTQRAGRTFLRDHLGRFGRAFASRIMSEDGDRHFGTLGWLLLTFLDAESARAGVQAGPVDLPVRPDTTDDTPMACGTADELIQIQRGR